MADTSNCPFVPFWTPPPNSSDLFVGWRKWRRARGLAVMTSLLLPLIVSLQAQAGCRGRLQSVQPTCHRKCNVANTSYCDMTELIIGSYASALLAYLWCTFGNHVTIWRVAIMCTRYSMDTPLSLLHFWWKPRANPIYRSAANCFCSFLLYGRYLAAFCLSEYLPENTART